MDWSPTMNHQGFLVDQSLNGKGRYFSCSAVRYSWSSKTLATPWLDSTSWIPSHPEIYGNVATTLTYWFYCQGHIESYMYLQMYANPSGICSTMELGPSTSREVRWLGSPQGLLAPGRGHQGLSQQGVKLVNCPGHHWLHVVGLAFRVTTRWTSPHWFSWISQTYDFLKESHV